MSDAGPSLSELLLGIGRDASRTPLEEYARTAAQGADGLGRQAGAAAIDAEPRVYASELLDRNTCGPCSLVDGAEYPDLAAGMEDYPTGVYRACEGGQRCRGTLVFVWPTEARPTGDDVPRHPPPDLSPPPAGPTPTPPPETPAAKRRRQRAEEREAERQALEELAQEEGMTPELVETLRRQLPGAREELRLAAARARDDSLRFLDNVADATRLAPAPKIKRRRNPDTGRMESYHEGGGEWDWFFELHPEEQKRLRRAARPGGIKPDVLADHWADTFGGSSDVDAVMAEWLRHNRRIEAGNAVSLGRTPNPDLYGGLTPDDLIESPYSFRRLYGDPADAVRHLAEVEAGEASDYAARAFRRPRRGDPEPWTMTEDEWVAEYSTFREVADALAEEAGDDVDDWGRAVDPDEVEILDRLEELLPEGIDDPDRPLTPRQLYAAMMDLARQAGFVK